MATRNQALSEIAKHGGVVDWDNSEITRFEKVIYVDAPRGHGWTSTGCHTLVLNWACGEANMFWDEVLEWAKDGIYADERFTSEEYDD